MDLDSNEEMKKKWRLRIIEGQKDRLERLKANERVERDDARGQQHEGRKTELDINEEIKKKRK